MPTLDTETDALINDMAKALIPVVKAIQAQAPTTKYHYGEYLAAIARLSNGHEGKQIKIAIGIALQRAGTDRQGVYHALKALGVV